MIIGVLCWFSAGSGQAHGTGTWKSGVKVSSVLMVGWSFGQEGFSLHDKWVPWKFLTVLSCQLFDIVYISVSILILMGLLTAR